MRAKVCCHVPRQTAPINREKLTSGYLLLLNFSANDLFLKRWGRIIYMGGSEARIGTRVT
jgi:hypothetical protein